MESATISDIHVLGVDGTGEQVLNGMYKEMTIDRLKRIITMLNRKPASSWESLQLYHLGNEMVNDQTLEVCGIQDRAIIRYVFTESAPERAPLPSRTPVAEASTALPSCDEAGFSGKELRAVFALDVDQSRSMNVGPVKLGMPVKAFIEKVASKQGIDPEHLRIIYKGKQLKEGNSLMDYGLQDEATVHCVIRVLGGVL
ncbi:uncharacterized protein PAC_10106 [Phialocephala subalpina]|uniref:Ubiquitin-like domain-containing protein n=1 Tax=Phialocephala subalpina TaxID=576137 RepID=A0A1L7X5B6_9HELO|nr:uncharacterized protein PAC_10106 [Phialocephala subalpina]